MIRETSPPERVMRGRHGTREYGSNVDIRRKQPGMFDLSGTRCTLGDQCGYDVRKRLGRATVLPMDAVIWLAIITAGAIAGIVTDSPWGGIIVAAIGIVLCGFLIVRSQPR